MKEYLILLLILIFALFQGAFLPLNLVLLTVLVWTALRPTKESLLVAFLAGLFLDLGKGYVLGFSSFAFLVFSFILISYSRRFNPIHPVFLPVFVFLSSNLYSLVANHVFNWPEGLILAILALIFGFLGRFFLMETDDKRIKLKYE